MPIWQLAPITTSASDDAWAFTRWFGPILVRAKSPAKARKIAAEAFGKTPVKVRDSKFPSLTSPWLDDGLVVCRRMSVSTYRQEGPDQILQPHVTEYNQG